MPRRRSTILIVDADRGDREFLGALLKHHRYAVLQAGDYWDAVDLYQQFPGRIDLLLTALALPGDNGYELARALFRRDDRLRALFVSAPTGAIVSPYYHMPSNGRHMLQKPLDADAVLEGVRFALRSRRRELKHAETERGGPHLIKESLTNNN
ncbi:MAG TPA: response regulator [Bryobacteraceae bacterium]|nr:response regulator [Bryobacteraceae bacterium]